MNAQAKIDSIGWTPELVAALINKLSNVTATTREPVKNTTIDKVFGSEVLDNEPLRDPYTPSKGKRGRKAGCKVCRSCRKTTFEPVYHNELPYCSGCIAGTIPTESAPAKKSGRGPAIKYPVSCNVGKGTFTAIEQVCEDSGMNRSQLVAKVLKVAMETPDLWV